MPAHAPGRMRCKHTRHAQPVPACTLEGRWPLPGVCSVRCTRPLNGQTPARVWISQCQHSWCVPGSTYVPRSCIYIPAVETSMVSLTRVGWCADTAHVMRPCVCCSQCGVHPAGGYGLCRRVGIADRVKAGRPLVGVAHLFAAVATSLPSGPAASLLRQTSTECRRRP